MLSVPLEMKLPLDKCLVRLISSGLVNAILNTLGFWVCYADAIASLHMTLEILGVGTIECWSMRMINATLNSIDFYIARVYVYFKTNIFICTLKQHRHKNLYMEQNRGGLHLGFGEV
jgi:hypothetical protein